MLLQQVHNKTGTQFRLEPGRLGRHDITRVGNINQLLHRNRVEGEGRLHLPAVDPFFQLAQSADAAYKIDPV